MLKVHRIRIVIHLHFSTVAPFSRNRLVSLLLVTTNCMYGKLKNVDYYAFIVNSSYHVNETVYFHIARHVVVVQSLPRECGNFRPTVS